MAFFFVIIIFHQFQFPSFWDEFILPQSPMSEDLVSADVFHLLQELVLGNVEVTIHEAIDAQFAPDGIAVPDRTPVKITCRIVYGVPQKIFQRNLFLLDLFFGKIVKFHNQ